jgi:hypothetical protein
MGGRVIQHLLAAEPKKRARQALTATVPAVAASSEALA